jgi:hypothetical protein
MTRPIKIPEAEAEDWLSLLAVPRVVVPTGVGAGTAAAGVGPKAGDEVGAEVGVEVGLLVVGHEDTAKFPWSCGTW